MRTCKNCGAQFPDDNNFCSRCGEKYTVNETSTGGNSQTTNSHTHSSSSNDFMRFLPLAVSILGFIIAWNTNWILGIIISLGSAAYSYSRYNSSKDSLDKLSMIVGAGASALIFFIMVFF